jgi:hypothetical protein
MQIRDMLEASAAVVCGLILAHTLAYSTVVLLTWATG